MSLPTYVNLSTFTHQVSHCRHGLPFRSHGPNSGNVPKVFRFCDLPKEIRILIYKEYFGRTILRTDNTSDVDGPYSPNEAFRDGVPSEYRHTQPIFQVSRLIRQESLSVFGQSVEFAHYVWGYECLSKIPPAYLKYVTEVDCMMTTVGVIDNRAVPNLQLLRVRLWRIWGRDGGIYSCSKEEICRFLVDKATRYFKYPESDLQGYKGGLDRWSDVHDGLQRRRAELGRLPFRVLLEPRFVEVWSRRGNGRGKDKLGEWRGLQIDWEKQEIVGGWPPPHWKEGVNSKKANKKLWFEW